MVRALSSPRCLPTVNSNNPAAEPNNAILSLVQNLERLQNHCGKICFNQPSETIRKNILSILDQRPEWRQRMAVMTSSPTLRQTILETVPRHGRAAGSAMLGETHIWRPHGTAVDRRAERDSMTLSHGPESLQTEYGDQNWPKIVPIQGQLGEEDLSSPVEDVKFDITKTRPKCYSIPQTIRFAPFELDPLPGPGHYFTHMIPKGLNYKDGEYVVLGANHVYPYKSLLSDTDATKMPSSPKYSFPKMRRCVSEVHTGQALRDVGPVKTDSCCLSPGPVYPHHSTFPNCKKPPGTRASRSPKKKWWMEQRSVRVT